MRPQDIVILLKLVAIGNNKWFMKDLSIELKISQSEVSESLNRSMLAGLISASKNKIMTNALLDFLIYGIKYVYPVKPGSIGRGVKTAHSAPPLDKMIRSDDIYVWPWAYGEARGQYVEPLFWSVPEVCQKDKKLYILLSLVEAIRIGKAREHNLAVIELKSLLSEK
ncbi:hypothetical protein ACFLR8_01175 [Bacteroidota bacterium]